MRKRTAALSLFVATALVAGCSSSAKTDSGSDGSAASNSGATATGPAITLGYLNTESGPLSFPDFTDGLNAAVTYVNTHGGVNGSPIKIDQCFTDGSPESSINCANKLIEDKVVGVLAGDDLGIDATIPIFDAAKLPAIALPVLGVQSFVNPNLFQLTATGDALDQAALVVMKRAGVHKIGYVVPDIPTMHSRYSSAFQVNAAKLGLTTNLIAYSLSAPDYAAAVQTAVAAGDQGIVNLSTDSGCLALASAVATNGFKGPVSYSTCQSFVDKLGAKAANAVLFSFLWLPSDAGAAPAAKQDQLETYVNAIKAAGHPELTNSINAAEGFALAINAANVLKMISGGPSPAALFTALRGLKNFDTFLGQPATCDPRPDPTKSSCTTSVLAYQVSANGDLKLNGTGYLDLSPAK